MWTVHSPFDPGNRRKSVRFPIGRELVYHAVSSSSRRSGRGVSRDISSGGISFSAGHSLPAGEEVEISISWPALLDGRLGLRLWVIGTVLRSDSETAVCTIDKYEFRIEGRAYRRESASAASA
jgi:hypothetical protein